MNWNRRTATWAALALLALTNAVALGGAAYNRMGEPQGTLQLTERELDTPYAWSSHPSEDSGLALRLNWRSLPPLPHDRAEDVGYDGGANPQWLGVGKMRELGFDGRALAQQRVRARAVRGPESLPHDAFVVLELGGDAYQESLRRAQHHEAFERTRNASSEAARDAGATLARAGSNDSRLFAIDAGLDRDALRAKYPDRTTYAIVRGQVRAIPRTSDAEPAGAISALSAGEINVPQRLRPLFESVRPVDGVRRFDAAARFQATVVFGARGEPWLASAARRRE